MQLTTELYKLTKLFPKDELYGLVSQIRRAAVSIPCNIAEGLGRDTPKDMLRFLFMARASLYELDTLLDISNNQDYIFRNEMDGIALMMKRCLQMIQGLMKKYNTP